MTLSSSTGECAKPYDLWTIATALFVAFAWVAFEPIGVSMEWLPRFVGVLKAHSFNDIDLIGKALEVTELCRASDLDLVVGRGVSVDAIGVLRKVAAVHLTPRSRHERWSSVRVRGTARGGEGARQRGALRTSLASE